MEKQRGVERLIFFTDAVAAIAITVLILPLVDIVTADASGSHPISVERFLAENVGLLLAFVLSFAIIARFWIANHGILADTIGATTVLIWLDIAWVFTIVVLPLPTEITAVYDASVLTTAIYIGTCLVSTLLLTAISIYLYRNPQLEREGKPTSTVQVWGIASTTGGFAVALALSLIFPRIHYYSLLVLLLSFPLDAVILPRLRRRQSAAERRRTPRR